MTDHRNWVLFAAAAVLLAVPALAQPGPGSPCPGYGPCGPAMMGHGMFTERMQYRLDLTDDQKLQIDSMIKAHQAEFAPFHEEMKQARLALYDAIHAETIDDAAIRDAAARVGELEADRAVARAEMFQKVRATLTPEQQAEAMEMIGEMRAFQEDNPGMMQHRGRHHGGKGWGRGR